MVILSELVKTRLDQDWLITKNADFSSATQFPLQLEKSLEKITTTIGDHLVKTVFIINENPVAFLANFLAAKLTGCTIFLGNPHWKQLEWQSVFQFVQPALILGENLPNLPAPSPEKPCSELNRRKPDHLLPPGAILIPTGGTSGQIRFAIHTWETLMASVQGFQTYFASPIIHSYCVLPLFHVSGLMQFLRSFVTEGTLIIQSFKQLETASYYPINPQDFFISLVPTQLQRLLKVPAKTQWLSEFKTVLLGGAPGWEGLFNQARSANIPLAPTYGMTETASQIATLKPSEFLAGNNSTGQILPHAQVTISGKDKNKKESNQQILGINEIGYITIIAKSMALGYYPDLGVKLLSVGGWQTDDLGFMDEQGYLRVIGRGSDKIITGGENVYPAEIEAVIKSTGLVEDVAIVGTPDPEWGETITAIYVPLNSQITLTQIQSAIQDKISKFKQPKHWRLVPKIPRNAQGKLNWKRMKK